MSYPQSLKPYKKELLIVFKTNTISTRDIKVQERVKELISIHENHYGKKLRPNCRGCAGDFLRRMARDYDQEIGFKKKASKKPVVKETVGIPGNGTPVEDYLTLGFNELKKACREHNPPLKYTNKTKKTELLKMLQNG